ncbi:MAG: NADP(H)-dependent aldo-keto reductase [Hyphomicrobiales bacterium]|nr:NADP(H)-dependent aldo-keto reductase [Hyphomicrobiales bacterium]
MEYRELGRTGVKVSALCLGTMTWGQQNTEAEGHEQMDYAVGEGINFFDTAELYPIPPRRETQGRTEEVIGSWMATRKNRDKIVIATKVVGRTQMTWFRKDGSPGRLTRAQIFEAVEGSLRRLRTDYIDLYQTHWPDRPLEIFGGLNYRRMEGDAVPIEETLDAMAELARQGKVRHVGVSNETSWGVAEHLRAAERTGAPRIASIQNAYNLLNRTFEIDLAEFAHREQVGLLAYSPLAQGYLSGKYEGGALPAGSRKALFQRLGRYETPPAAAAISAYLALAREAGLDPAQMALQYVTQQPFVTSNIIGATTMAQLKTDIASARLVLSADVLKRIEDIHLMHSNPCP